MAPLQVLTGALVLLAALSVAKPVVAQPPQEAESTSAAVESHFDTEHIFGFGESSDVGKEREWEIESFTLGVFEAVGRNFSVGNETSLRYTIFDGFRLSVGVLPDYLNLHNALGLGARNGLNVSGLITAARWNILDWRIAPLGVTFSVDPEWRRTIPQSGRFNDNIGVAAAILIDKEVIPEKLFMELNLVYSPTWLPLHGKWRRDDAFTVLVGGSYVITSGCHENLAPSGFPNVHALFVGPHLFLQLAKSLTASFAWAFLVPDLGTHHADLANFERYEAGLRIVYGF